MSNLERMLKSETTEEMQEFYATLTEEEKAEFLKELDAVRDKVLETYESISSILQTLFRSYSEIAKSFFSIFSQGETA